MLTVSWPKCTVRYRALVCVLCSTAMCLWIATEGSMYWRLGGLGNAGSGWIGDWGRGKLGGVPRVPRHSRVACCVAAWLKRGWARRIAQDPNPTSKPQPSSQGSALPHLHMQVRGHHVRVPSPIPLARSTLGPHIPCPHPQRIHIATSVSTHTSIGPSETGRAGPAAQLPWLSQLLRLKPSRLTDGIREHNIYLLSGCMLYVDLCTRYLPAT